jgi:tetratricopeptide (TPR) repeat protein
MGDEKWHLIPNFFSHKDPVTVNKYIARLKQKKEIKEMNYLTVLASGISTDGHSAFSSFDINYKSDVSLLYVNVKNEWKIDNVIFGEINLIYSETDTIKHIANYLAQKEYERAFTLIKQAEEIYYLSPDILYNKGMYFSLKSQLNEALKAFAEAAELDVLFAEPLYNQAFIYHSENKLEEAKRLYEKTLTLQKNNVNALNNLGTIYLQEKDYGNAKYYFEECLKFDPEFQYAIDNLKLVEGIVNYEA